MDIRIIDDNTQLRRKIGEALKEKVKRRFDSAIRKSEKEIQTLLEQAITNSDTYDSLVGGDLRAELGLSSQSVADLKANVGFLFTLEQYFYEGQSSPIVTSKGISYARGIEITVDPDLDFFAYYTAKGEFIPWLDWLINGKGNTFSSGYKVYKKEGKGRSGMAIMLKSEGDSYTVDSRFVGSINDNWITKIISNNKENIKEIFESNAKKSK